MSTFCAVLLLPGLYDLVEGDSYVSMRPGFMVIGGDLDAGGAFFWGGMMSEGLLGVIMGDWVIRADGYRYICGLS